jgi:hypothetical protein
LNYCQQALKRATILIFATEIEIEKCAKTYLDLRLVGWYSSGSSCSFGSELSRAWNFDRAGAHLQTVVLRCELALAASLRLYTRSRF